MPLVLEESRARDVPVGSKLQIKVATKSTHVNATGLVSKPDETESSLKHDEIMNSARTVTLTQAGRYIIRVNLILNAKTSEKATVEYTIDKPGSGEIRSFKPSFTGKSSDGDKFIGRAKYVISTV